MTTGQPPVRAVVFDVGGVLVDWNPRHLYRKVFSDEEEVEVFLSTVCTLEWHSHHDGGRPMDESIPELCGQHPHLAAEIQMWRERYVEMVGGTIDGMGDLVDDLRDAGVPLYLLSNMPAEVFDDLRASFAMFDAFDGAVISGQERIMKPDPRIFGLTAERFELDPAVTLFVDDVEVNVAAATTSGFQGVQFTSSSQLRTELMNAALLP